MVRVVPVATRGHSRRNGNARHGRADLGLTTPYHARRRRRPCTPLPRLPSGPVARPDVLEAVEWVSCTGGGGASIHHSVRLPLHGLLAQSLPCRRTRVLRAAVPSVPVTDAAWWLYAWI